MQEEWIPYEDEVIEEEMVEEIIPEESIEDEPERIDLLKFLKIYFREWKLLLICMAVCGALMGILRPGTSSTVHGASVTLYVPPYVYREVDGKQIRSSNSVSQIQNALGLIQSKVYRDLVAQELGADSLSGYGGYTVSRQKDTELITIRATGPNQEKAMELCSAVQTVFAEQVGKEVSINDMLEVDPVTPFSNVTATSTMRSVLVGSLMGAAFYTVYAAIKYFTDRTLSTKEEVEEYLDLPVLAVFPLIDEDGTSSKDSPVRQIRRSLRRLKRLHGRTV